MLANAYGHLNRQAAVGIDGESWEQYGENLIERIEDLHTQLHTGKYRPKPSKRIWIPKGKNQKRPIGIAALEDKIVQQALVWILEAIYEQDFLGFSYGFRPGRSQHDALDALSVAITEKKVSWVLDADIKGFFDNISHDWLIKFIEHRVSDKRILNIISRTLKAGVSEEGKLSKTVVGTPQGAVISPLLGNIYLHYVLDLWVNRWRNRNARGEVYIVRYADDFVTCLQYQSDGKRLQRELNNDVAQFNLELHPEKTKLIEFGRFAKLDYEKRGMGKPETFSFLGFTHSCSTWKKNGKFTLRRKTISKRLREKVKEVKDHLLKIRAINVHIQGAWLRKVVQGYMNYHGVPGNRKALDAFRTQICRNWIRALRRRSQKGRKLNWCKMQFMIRRYIPSIKIVHPFPNIRFHA